MKTICLYFQVHQPLRLRKYRFFNMGKDHNYLDDLTNQSIMQKVARLCYLPMNSLLLNLIKEHKGAFKVSFSITGTAIDQFREYAPEVLESFKELAKTGCVEFLAETYSHSLVQISLVPIHVAQPDFVNFQRFAVKQTQIEKIHPVEVAVLIGQGVTQSPGAVNCVAFKKDIIDLEFKIFFDLENHFHGVVFAAFQQGGDLGIVVAFVAVEFAQFGGAVAEIMFVERGFGGDIDQFCQIGGFKFLIAVEQHFGYSGVQFELECDRVFPVFAGDGAGGSIGEKSETVQPFHIFIKYPRIVFFAGLLAHVEAQQIFRHRTAAGLFKKQLPDFRSLFRCRYRRQHGKRKGERQQRNAKFAAYTEKHDEILYNFNIIKQK